VGAFTGQFCVGCTTLTVKASRKVNRWLTVWINAAPNPSRKGNPSHQSLFFRQSYACAAMWWTMRRSLFFRKMPFSGQAFVMMQRLSGKFFR
jgi:hypothetical protein